MLTPIKCFAQLGNSELMDSAKQFIQKEYHYLAFASPELVKDSYHAEIVGDYPSSDILLISISPLIYKGHLFTTIVAVNKFTGMIYSRISIDSFNVIANKIQELSPMDKSFLYLILNSRPVYNILLSKCDSIKWGETSFFVKHLYLKDSIVEYIHKRRFNIKQKRNKVHLYIVDYREKTIQENIFWFNGHNLRSINTKKVAGRYLSKFVILR